ncbi:MAG: helix-turn-helix domain-containing protein [Christensenellaceae bacterium]|nr:helix-turn-helix domain-containing protein [Christensenellaceae bacterium]
MYEEFTQERIALLRTQKGVTARDMSLSIGQNSSYINRIENKKTLPSMQAFFYICEYLGITPQEFYDAGNPNPAKLESIIADLKTLDDEALASIAGVIKEMRGRK